MSQYYAQDTQKRAHFIALGDREEVIGGAGVAGGRQGV